jgi:4-carboxymuconolactone decarboxylase
LPLKTRCLVQVAIFTALDRAQQLRTYVPGVLRAGNTAEEALEAVFHCAPYCGFPKAADALKAIVECAGSSDTDAPRAQAAPTDPESIRKAVLGGDVTQADSAFLSHALAQPWSEMISPFLWKMWARPQLSLKTRCLLQVAILTAMDRHAQLREYLPGILRAGNTPEEVMEVVLQCAVYCGFPKAADSVQALLETVAGAPAVSRR